MNSSGQYHELLESDPGNPVFAQYADELRKDGKSKEALEVCLAGLTHNPGCHRGRLVLARVFYEAGYLPFTIREVEQLHREVPNSAAVRKLLEKLSPGSVRAPSSDSIKKAPSSSTSTAIEGESDIKQAELAGATEGPSGAAIDDTVAEADFDFDDLDLIDSKK